MSSRDREVKFVVDGSAVPWARARQGRVNDKPVFFSAKKQAAFSVLIREAWRQALQSDGWRPAAPHDGPVMLTMRTYWPIPASRPKRWRAEAALEGTPYVSRGRHDWDNLGKIVGDALNGIAWGDDGQIYLAMVGKFYSLRPRMEVEIILRSRT